MGVLIFIPVFVMVVLAFLRFDGPVPSLRRAAPIWAGLIILFLMARAFTPDSVLYPESESTRKINWLKRHLLKTNKGWEERPVVVLEGSSAMQYGIDPERLQAKLQEGGYPATVMQFSMAGANHYERLYMFEYFLREIGWKKRRDWNRADKSLWSEVFDAYDHNPLYLFEKEAYSERAIQHMTPSVAWRAWQAYKTYYPSDPAARGASMAWVLLEHAMLNRFAVGVFSDMNPPPKREFRTPPFFGLSGKKGGFDFTATVELFEQAQADGNQAAGPGKAWAIYEKQMLAGPGRSMQSRGYIALPTIESARRNYQETFRNQRATGTQMIGPVSEAELEAYLQEDYWFDGVHFTGPGAEAYTDWLAGQILKKQP